MDDLISRRNLMTTLDIKEDCHDCAYTALGFCTRSSEFANACEAITDAPSIDAVEVVRCRDCKHRFTFDCPRKIEIKNNALIAGGTFVISNTNDDSFCEKGERRE